MYDSAIARFVSPATFRRNTSRAKYFILLYFLGIVKPPVVVLLLYNGRLFIFRPYFGYKYYFYQSCGAFLSLYQSNDMLYDKGNYGYSNPAKQAE